MKYLCCACSFFILNTFFCIGGRLDHHRVPAEEKTFQKTEIVSFLPRPATPKPVTSRTSIGRAKARFQRRNKQQSTRKDWKNNITQLCLFPNKYEYEAVYKCLREKGVRFITDGEIALCFKKLYRKHPENSALALVKFKDKDFLIATCGEGTFELMQVILNCFNLFKNLKTVFLGGICGCANVNVKIGDILISENYYYIKKTSIGNPSDRQVDGVVDKEVLQCGDSYFFKKDLITTKFNNCHKFISEVIEALSVDTRRIQMGINCSLDSFVDSADCRDSICSTLKKFMCEENSDVEEDSIIFFNMEDGQIADQCESHNCKFYAFRVVSDYAGGTGEIENGGRELACEKLGDFFVEFMNFLKMSV